MFYERKIRYLDYYRNGERFKNGGFAKTEVRDDIFKLEIVLKGISHPDTESVDVLLWGDGREIILGQAVVKNCCSDFFYSGSLKNGIDGSGIEYSEIRGIRIPLGMESEISCKWQTDGEPVQKKPEEVTAAEQHVKETREIETIEKEYQQEQSDDKQKAWPEEENREREKKPETIALSEDKWFQLLAIYPHIKPFCDEREYLSIGPADLVLFTSASYRASNNSFLLHGYYNYHHLILTRIERRGEILYYLGVPGNYYDREKQVAVMFGFESFECAEEPAQNGDFGYYMMRVQL